MMRENPFARSDRIHFPAMTHAMWECSSADSFGTPEAGRCMAFEATPIAGRRSPGWTPGSRELSWLTPPRSADGQRVDAFFAERERRCLVTPARIPSDFMQRGSLYDPNQSRSGSSSRSGLTPSSIHEPADSLPSSHARASALRVRTSPGVRTSPAPLARRDGVARSCSRQRSVAVQTRVGIGATAPDASPSNWSNWSSQGSTGGSPDSLLNTLNTQAAPRAPRGAARSSGDLGAREHDSLSISSVSFGREDARMRSSEARDRAAVHSRGERDPKVGSSCRVRVNNSSGVARKGDGQRHSVARQLEFGADGGTPRAPSPLLPKAKDDLLPHCMGTSYSEWDLVDWDSSLSQEVVSVKKDGSRKLYVDDTHLCSVPTSTLQELSPLRSVSPEGFSSIRFESKAEEGSFPELEAVPETSERRQHHVERELRSSQQALHGVSVEASALADGKPVPVFVENIRSGGSSGSIVLQVRLRACGHGLKLEPSEICGRQGRPLEQPTEGSLQRSLSVPYVSQLASCSPTQTSGTMALEPVESPSLDDLQLAVRALRARYLERFLHLKSPSGNFTPPSERCRRRLSGCMQRSGGAGRTCGGGGAGVRSTRGGRRFRSC
mmetsp:Transcript_16173/g.30099  ORF Transcript_16173/g.30099 Transcript_16173/m.30099 type:complete len:609 (-) Transcript_16173:80-1906(-)